MKLTGDLKKIVYNSKTREEARAAIEDAGMILNDEELDSVSGGMTFRLNPVCPLCGESEFYILVDTDSVPKYVCNNPDCLSNLKNTDPDKYKYL